MPPRLNFQFRYQPQSGGRYAPLVNYYNAGNGALELPRREFVMRALEAYWMPSALEWEGKSPAAVRRAAHNAIYQLQLHAHYLRERFGLAESVQPALERGEENLEGEVDCDYEADLSGEDAVLDALM
jgi:hypothetical protein